MRNLLYFSLLLLLYSCSSEVKNTDVSGPLEISQWRGDNRDGKYNETNLLKSWSANGPQLLWFNDSIGDGYGSPAICSDAVFVLGGVDSSAYLFSFDLKGKLLWKIIYGKEWSTEYKGCRSTPTVIGDLIYVCSGRGDLACIEKESGKIKWSKNLVTDFHGKNIFFGYSESPLVNDSLVFATPGGKDTNVIALNRFTGELKWKSKAKEQVSAYCSPLMIKLAKRNLLVTFSENELFGLDAKNGEMLWSQKQDTFCTIHGNTPFYENGFIYYAAGCGNGIVKLELSADGSTVKETWKSTDLINYFSGVVKVNDRIFGSCEDKRKLVSINTNTGKILDSLKFSKGVTIYADSLIYYYNDKGQVGLIKSWPDSLQLISSFKINKGTQEHFSHPVIKNGVLYIRHGKSLMAYNIKQ